MAREEIKLVGSFDDQITKKLQKLNREISNMSRSFERFNKKLAPVTKSFAKMAMSAQTFSSAMNTQRSSIEGSSRAMREYSRQAGKMTSAMRKISAEREKARRAQGMSRAEARKQGSGGGTSTVLPSTQSSPKSGGASKIGAVAGQSFMKNVASTAIGMTIANAFASGVNKMKNLFMAPFQKFNAAFAERMEDEMNDIKSAGGLFALDMDLTADSGNERLFKNFNEALRYQEEINTRMAQSASNLPGTTSDFVNMNRRMTDSLQMVMENNREAFVALGERQGADISAGGIDAAKESLAQVGQNLTESLMLASAGQQGGLPMDLAVQQMLGAEKGKFKALPFTNKFRAAFQKNPLLKNFLIRAEAEINATAANSAERLEVISDVYARAIPLEQIDKMRGSLKGLMESVRSGLLDPQGGLFGLSRAVQAFDDQGNVIGPIMKDNVNNLGEKLYKVGSDLKDAAGNPLLLEGKEVKKGAELTVKELKDLGIELDSAGNAVRKGRKMDIKISQSTTYLFEQIREILANYGSVLTQFVGMLPTIFDPFANMTGALNDMRGMSIEFFRVFQTTNKQLFAHVDYMKETGNAAQKGLATRLNKQVMQRGALFTLADFLAGTGAMDAKRAEELKKQFVGKESMSEQGVASFDQVASKAFKEMFDALMGSKLMEQIGKMLGTLVGGILETTFAVINGLFTGIFKTETGNVFMKGFLEGFEGQFAKMGGFDGFMQKVNQLLSQAIEVAANLLLTKVIPALMKSFAQFILAGFTSGPISALISGTIVVKLVLGLNALWKAASAAAISLQAVSKGAMGFAKGNANMEQWQSGRNMRQSFGKNFSRGAIGKRAMSGLRAGGAASLLFGALDAGTKIAAGEDAGKAIGGAAAQVVGGTLGGILGQVLIPVPGLGAMVGTAAGSMLGDHLFNQFASPAERQAEAAEKMKEAADKHMAAVVKATGGEVTSEVAAATTNPMKTIAALKATGLLGTEAGTEVSKASTELREKTEIAGYRQTDLDEVFNRLKGLGMSDENIVKNPAYVAAFERAKTATEEAAAANERLSAAINKFDPAQLESFLGALQLDDKALQDMADAAVAAGRPLTEFEAIGARFNSSMDALPSQAEGYVDQIGAVWTGASTTSAGKMTTAADGLATSINNAANKINGIKVPTAPALGGVETKYDGKGGKMMPLGAAIAKERKMMPAGANLVIANSSETVIPAYAGHMGEGFKNFSFAEMESAAGFDRMKSYTDQIGELADRTAEKFSMGGLLGGGSATLNAMEALGNANGLITTSGFRPGDPGFHGANRARDLSNGSGQTPEMDKVANIMASNFGQSLTELIYTPLGFSIKNGQKTGLISPDNHYHHIHVAVAEGLKKAAVFSSQQAAEAYERKMMPAGSEPMKVNLGSMTANSSEMGGVQIGSINVHGVDNPKEIAEQVADEILAAVNRSSYTELFTS